MVLSLPLPSLFLFPFPFPRFPFRLSSFLFSLFFFSPFLFSPFLFSPFPSPVFLCPPCSPHRPAISIPLRPRVPTLRRASHTVSVHRRRPHARQVARVPQEGQAGLRQPMVGVLRHAHLPPSGGRFVHDRWRGVPEDRGTVHRGCLHVFRLYFACVSLVFCLCFVCVLFARCARFTLDLFPSQPCCIPFRTVSQSEHIPSLSISRSSYAPFHSTFQSYSVSFHFTFQTYPFHMHNAHNCRTHRLHSLCPASACSHVHVLPHHAHHIRLCRRCSP